MQVGKSILEKYKIENKIGGGSFANVYRATEKLIGRTVAIKAIPQDNYPQGRIRYLFSELSVMGTLWGNPHIVSIHTVEPEDSHHMAYIVMEYVNGANLKKAMVRNILSQEKALGIMLDVCSGLIAAHKHKIIHRDIKPQNILLTAENKAKISDFGVARFVAEASEEMAMTVTGTPKYMSPEQQEGGNYDQRADLYSVALVTCELMTGGKYPFPGNRRNEVYEDKVSGNFELSPELPPDFVPFMEKALNSNLRLRYQSADEMFQALDRIRRKLYSEFVEEAIDEKANFEENNLPECQRLLLSRRRELCMTDDSAALIDAEIWERKSEKYRQKSKIEVAESISSHHEKAKSHSSSKNYPKVMGEMQHAHRLALATLDRFDDKNNELRSVDRIFHELSDLLRSNADSQKTASKVMSQINELPDAEKSKFKRWLEKSDFLDHPTSSAMLPLKPRERISDRTNPKGHLLKNQSESPSPSNSNRTAKQNPELMPESILRNLHRTIRNEDEEIAVNFIQSAEDCFRQGRMRQGKKKYKNCGEHYSELADSLAIAKEWEIAGDYYSRAKLAYAAAVRENDSRTAAECSGMCYSRLANKLERKKKWIESGEFYILSGDEHKYAGNTEFFHASQRRAEVCYLNAAENAMALKQYEDAYNSCRKTLELAEKISGPSKKISGPSKATAKAKMLMNEIRLTINGPER